jgi:hypothetical protein
LAQTIVRLARFCAHYLMRVAYSRLWRAVLDKRARRNRASVLFNRVQLRSMHAAWLELRGNVSEARVEKARKAALARAKERKEKQASVMEAAQAAAAALEAAEAADAADRHISFEAKMAAFRATLRGGDEPSASVVARKPKDHSAPSSWSAHSLPSVSRASGHCGSTRLPAALSPFRSPSSGVSFTIRRAPSLVVRAPSYAEGGRRCGGIFAVHGFQGAQPSRRRAHQEARPPLARHLGAVA